MIAKKISKEEFLKLKENWIQQESDWDGEVYTTTYILPNKMEIQEVFVSTEHDENGEMIIEQEDYYLYV